ncbi:hypothetical protein WJS89_10785 [Sphingomicrobium sp. XHP0235]|uniref:hypothetical protein n=1 Tax=Sphingomicrobium aquimarinum TaxID=3133971 RepID=UPI0031FF3363
MPIARFADILIAEDPVAATEKLGIEEVRRRLLRRQAALASCAPMGDPRGRCCPSMPFCPS